MFNSLFPLLLWWFGIIYLLWEFTWEISCTVPTWDHCQNPPSFYLYLLILLGLFYSSLSASLCSPWRCVLSCHIWNISWFLVLSSLLSIPLPYIHTYYSWSTLAFCLWSYRWTFQCLLVVLVHHMLLQYLFCNHDVFPLICILIQLILLPPSTPWVTLASP